MAMERLPAAHDRSNEQTVTDERRDTVVIVGAGQNTLHMRRSINRLAQEHPVHVFEVNDTPPVLVDSDRFHLTDTPEGLESSQRLLGSGAVHASYLSVVPRLHEPLLNEHVGYAGEGLIDFTVIPKPFAQNVKEMVAMRALIRAAETRRRELDPSYDPEQSPLVHIHEHYKEKGAWHVVREQLNSMTRRLGRLESVSVDIQERRTAEDEDRLDAFQGGALEDLGPHVISLGLDVQSSVNTTDRYAIPNRSHTTVERFRYDNSDLPEGVETSFIVRGGTTIIDKERDESHEVSFTWSGGKGLVDKKEAILVFVHPDTSVRSLVIVDLKENKLTVPPEVSDLFPETQFEDNGYGYSVEAGLNGGDPRQSFQSLAEAEIVTKWQHVLARQGASQPPRIHETGLELQELAHAA